MDADVTEVKNMFAYTQWLKKKAKKVISKVYPNGNNLIKYYTFKIDLKQNQITQ